MFSLEPLDPSEQQTTQPVPQLQQCDALYRLAVSEPLPADSRQAANMQPVRPWSSHSMDRPTSAVGGSIQRPTSAAAKNQPDASGKPASADIMQQEPAGAEAVHDSTTGGHHVTTKGCQRLCGLRRHAFYAIILTSSMLAHFV